LRIQNFHLVLSAELQGDPEVEWKTTIEGADAKSYRNDFTKSYILRSREKRRFEKKLPSRHDFNLKSFILKESRKNHLIVAKHCPWTEFAYCRQHFMTWHQCHDRI